MPKTKLILFFIKTIDTKQKNKRPGNKLKYKISLLDYQKRLVIKNNFRTFATYRKEEDLRLLNFLFYLHLSRDKQGKKIIF